MTSERLERAQREREIRELIDRSSVGEDAWVDCPVHGREARAPFHGGCVLCAWRELPPLPETTILLTEVGSTAHGTGLAGADDLDLMGVFVEEASEVLGLTGGRRSEMHRTKPEGIRSVAGDVDRTMHPLRRFLHLAAGGNPSILMVLWAPVVSEDGYGADLRVNAEWFVGRHVIPRYRGYMQEQALRLLGLKSRSGHGRRGGGGREELIEAHGYDTKYAMHCARLGFQGVELLTTGRMELPMGGEPGEWLRRVRRGDVPFDEWWERALYLDANLAAFGEEDSIPPQPARAAIERWSVATHQEYWADREPPGSPEPPWVYNRG